MFSCCKHSCLWLPLPLPLVALAWRLASPLRFEPPPSGWVWTLPDICVINIEHHHLAAGPCPAHNKANSRAEINPNRWDETNSL